MAAYLTPTEAATRLQGRYGITAELFDGDLEAASDALDASGPFAGWRTEREQEREWPRFGTVAVPDSVLDWVCLRALRTATNETPAVTAESADGVSFSYASPRAGGLQRRMDGLLAPYLLRVGRLA